MFLNNCFFFLLQIKRRLRKSIADKDELIIQLNLSIEKQQNENASLLAKMQCNEKISNTLRSKNNELTQMLDEFKMELEKQYSEVRALTESNAELQYFIKESKKTDVSLDVSVECLDVSFGRNGTSVVNSSYNSSPENLGNAVIDIQLREQQVRNQDIMQKLIAMQQENESLSSNLEALKTKYSIERQQLDDQLTSLKNENKELGRHQECAKAESWNLYQQITRLNALNSDLLEQNSKKDLEIDSLHGSNKDLYAARSRLEEEMGALNRLIEELKISVTEHTRIEGALEEKSKNLQQTINGLHEQVDTLEMYKKTLSSENKELLNKLAEINVSINLLNLKLSAIENQKNKIDDENEKLKISQR